MEFTGKVAIVTGAASGMGLLCAQKLAEEGAKVVLTDVNAERLAACTTEIVKKGGEASFVKTDVRVYAEVEGAAKFTVEKYGRIDILINCAGGSAPRVFGTPGGFHDIPLDVLEWGIDVNFRGPILFCRAVFGTMLEQQSGVVINLGSISGMAGGSPDYGAAKAGMIGLTKSLARQGAPHGIRACCVSPGPVLTRPEMANLKTPMGRAAEPIEVVNLILYLCSDKAAFITGCNYPIDGGYSSCR